MNQKFLRNIFVAMTCAIVLLLPTGLHAAVRTPKIDNAVAEKLAQGETTRALIVMAEQADVSAANTLSTKQEKGAYVFNTLRAAAERTQANVRAVLTQRGIAYRAYAIVNAIAVENLDAVTAAQIAALSEVGRVAANPDVKFAAPVSSAPAAEAAAAIEWNVLKVGADKLWAQKIRGQGIVIANSDTGVMWEHPALKNKYRGYTKKTDTVDHNYNWWDAIHNDVGGGSTVCGYSSVAPCDDYGHGTHTMGTAVGGTRTDAIGVAPRAKWIACRNMDNGVGRPSTYIECFDFFLAPWDANGNNADPSRAPDVVSNSWGCPPSELCTPDSIQTATENLRAAGIFVVASAGNEGSSCSSIANPIGIFDVSTTVGATDSADALASFSSRGPVTADSSNRRKPDISAPGVNVRSSTRNGSYGTMSGTSMAAPHVAAAVALLWQANANLRGNVDRTEKILFNTAYRSVQAGSQVCGGTDKTVIPNNLFGYGRLDVWKAYQKTAK